jgi:hypothetical protein
VIGETSTQPKEARVAVPPPTQSTKEWGDSSTLTAMVPIFAPDNPEVGGLDRSFGSNEMNNDIEVKAIDPSTDDFG